jgi:mannose-6-phosphate isomerase-like protein (cupin superfamily)
MLIGGDEVTFRVTSRHSDGAILAFDVRMPSGGGPPAMHRHEPFEVYRVERGQLAFYLEGEDGGVKRTLAGPGSVVAIPGGREHTIRNESDREASAFVAFTPGTRMERFLRAAGELAAHGTPRVEDVLAVAQAHGVEITRPLEAVAA